MRKAALVLMLAVCGLHGCSLASDADVETLVALDLQDAISQARKENSESGGAANYHPSISTGIEE